MAIESINREFEVFMREMVKMQECAQENIESDFRRLLKVTVNSCATMYGFSAEEALKRLNSSGEIIEVPVVLTSRQKELEKAEKVRVKELEKVEKAQNDARLKEAQKLQKVEIKAFEKAEKQRRFAFENAKKCLEKVEKANERSERNQMKEQDIALASKAINLKKNKKTVTKKVKIFDRESLASTVIMTDSEDEEIHVLFQNIPLIEELNSIRNIKNQKKLSSGVKLARQILDI
jgi:hypothetical protein